MLSIQYNKLVRDRIPEIIEMSGKVPTYRVMSEMEYLSKLNEKLREEVAEYQESQSMEELADIMEVIHAIAIAHGSSMQEIENIRQNKADERGGFEKKLLLIEVHGKD